MHHNVASEKIVYRRCGNFHVGIIFHVFAILPSSQEFYLYENKTHYDCIRKYWDELYPENYPHKKGLANISTKFPPPPCKKKKQNKKTRRLQYAEMQRSEKSE